jgi:hypothetical protein
MNSSESSTSNSQTPSLFQIAAFFEDFFPAAGSRRSEAAMAHLPIAEYMLDPAKLMAVLRRNGTAGAPPKSQPKRRPRSPARQSASSAPDGRPTGMGPDNREDSDGLDGGPEPSLQRKVEFTFRSPLASSVRLAGDFTDWEEHAIELMHSPDGIWFTVVPLAPGSYCYRFIVDGQWRDDPASTRRAPNPFGTENAMICVT